MAKSADAFRTISEVADWLETPAHVLRFWESKFSQVKPVKRAGGRRYYRPADMKLLGGIKRLLHDDGMTIKGVQKLLREQGIKHVSGLSQPLGDAADDDMLDAELVQATPTEEPAAILTFSRAESEPEPVEKPPAQTAQPPEPEADDAPVLPSFMQRRDPAPDAAAPEPARDVPQPEPEPEPEPPKRPAIVSVPADPDDNKPASPGILARLGTLPHPLSEELTDRLSQLAARLRAASGPANRD